MSWTDTLRLGARRTPQAESRTFSRPSISFAGTADVLAMVTRTRRRGSLPVSCCRSPQFARKRRGATTAFRIAGSRRFDRRIHPHAKPNRPDQATDRGGHSSQATSSSIRPPARFVVMHAAHQARPRIHRLRSHRISRQPHARRRGLVMSGGRASRQKGNRTERAIVRLLQARGFAAERSTALRRRPRPLRRRRQRAGVGR